MTLLLVASAWIVIALLIVGFVSRASRAFAGPADEPMWVQYLLAGEDAGAPAVAPSPQPVERDRPLTPAG